jgi:hypothetical protein
MNLVRHKTLLAISLLCLFCAIASATPVNGTLGFVGPGVLTFSTGSGAPGTNFIDWCPVNVGPQPGDNCGVNNNGRGVLFVASTSGSFTAVDPFNSPGSIVDITDNPAAPPPYTFLGLNPGSVPGFLDFVDPWTYTVTQIEPQTCAATATQVCTGYFQLVQVGSSVSVNLSARGTITAGGDISPFTLLITGNFAGSTIPQVIAAATSQGGIFTNSWSGELKATGTAVPEPGTIAMSVLGLALVTSARCISRRRNA